MKKVDFLIVGQGIAGTLLAWFLGQANQSFFIIDKGHEQSSTKIAAGLINPITGRRFVKSWMIEELLPLAKHTYQEIERTTGLKLWSDIEVIRYFQTIAEGNNWVTKTYYEDYQHYLSEEPLKDNLNQVVFNTGGYGIVKGAKVNVGELIKFYQRYYLEQKQLLVQEFDYKEIRIKKNGITYKDIEAGKVIFCEGFAAATNPWFSHLPYESAKGEVLILNIPNLSTSYVLKKNQFIVPVEENHFWFGSTYEWDDLTNSPTEAGKLLLQERLAEILKVDVEVVDHLAAIRPILKDRRPVLGFHQDHPQLGIFNGLGTKGTSIAPYWADKFVDHLVNGTPLMEEVLVDRFIL